MATVRKLHHSDTDVLHHNAYAWLRQCSRLYNVKVRDVEEDATTKKMTGRILQVLDIVANGTKVILDKERFHTFCISVGDHLPEIFVYLPGGDKPYRVYHECHFDMDAVYPLGKLLRAKTAAEVDALAWYDELREFMFPYTFHITFLKQEIAESGCNEEHAQALRGMLKPFEEAMKAQRDSYYKAKREEDAKRKASSSKKK